MHFMIIGLLEIVAEELGIEHDYSAQTAISKT